MIRTIAIAALLTFGMGGAVLAADAPTDAQIAHIAYTAGQLDITAAEQAIKKSKNAEIIAFAKQMEEDHKAVNDQALALVKKLNVTPEDNPTSQALSKAAADKVAELDKLSGVAAEAVDVESWETTNLVTISTALADAASRREETRGSHWREDFPDRDDAGFAGHFDVRMQDGETEVVFVPSPATDTL